MVVAGHYLAAQAGFKVLEAGGNAIDAGVAAGLTLGVVQSEFVNIAGVAPIIVYLAETDEVVTLSGLGTWPEAASLEMFIDQHGGSIPQGLLRTIVPAAPDAWITALQRYGTMAFGEVAGEAIRLARDGFIMYPLMAEIIEMLAEDYRQWPSNAEIYLPNGKPPEVGDRFIQTDLAGTLQYMADEEAAAAGGRNDGLEAARGAFYRGDIARAIVDFHEHNGGLMTMADMAEFRSVVEAPVKRAFKGIDVYTCGPWCQGPVLLQMLAVLDSVDLKALGHNTAAYIHMLTEAMKLSFADRECYYGDPKFVDVPLEMLLSDAYAAKRRKLIKDTSAWPEMPPPGGPLSKTAPGLSGPSDAGGTISPQLDTSYVCVIDGSGNAFSATPSDVSCDTPVIPGTGLCPSSRGSQSWAVPGHASAIAAGKRPRLTPNPALVLSADVVMPFGTPGGDVQSQAMLQALLNLHVFDMDPQEAVEAPRFASYSFPDSFEPHGYLPGRLNLEAGIGRETGETLSGFGHDVEWWPERTWRAGGVCIALADRQRGVLTSGADPRRPCYALGW